MTSENRTPATDNNSPRRPARTFLLVLLSILFVISALVTVINYDVWRVFFNPPLIKSILRDEFIESDLVPRVLEDFSARRAAQRVERGEALSGVDEPDIQLLLSYVNFESWKEIKNLIITDDFITHLVSVSVDGIYAWLDTPDPMPALVWEMFPIKDRLVGQDGEDAIITAYRTLPECTPEDLEDFHSRLEAMPPGVEVLYNLCQFPDPWEEDQIGDYVNALIDFNQNVPAAYNFNQMLGGGLAASGAARLIKSALKLNQFLGPWGWTISLALLVLIALIGVRSVNAAGKWLGIPILISGVLTLGIHFLIAGQVPDFVAGRLASQLSPLLITEISASIGHLTVHVFQPLLVEGLVLSGVGLVLIILGAVVKKRKK